MCIRDRIIDPVGNSSFFIGVRQDLNQYFNGNISDLTIWNSTLDQDQITAYNSISFSGNEEGLVGYWNFNEGEGSPLTDLSGNGNDGTIYGATWSGDAPVPPVFGCADTYAENYDPDATADDGSCDYPDNGNYSLDFNGSGDHVNLGTSPTLEISGDISMATWVKINNFDNQNAGVVSKVSDGSAVGYAIEKTSTENRLSFWTGDGNGFCEVVSPVLSTDTWYFVAATNDGSTSRIYINGELTNTSNCGAPAGPTADLRIGVHSILSNNERYWDGSIDDVSIWDAVLTDNDILNLYETSVNGGEEGLVAYWSFNSGDGSTLYDHSGNANHGVIDGAMWSDDAIIPPTPPVSGGNNSLRCLLYTSPSPRD